MSESAVRGNAGGVTFACHVALLSLVCFVAVLPAFADRTPPVPLDDGVYGLLERLEALGAVEGLDDGMRPLSRARVGDLLAAAETSSLSAIDRARLDSARERFGAVPPRPGVATSSPLGVEAPLRYGAQEGWLSLDLLARQQTDRFSPRQNGDEPEWILRNRLGAVVSGELGERVGVRVSFEQTREEGIDHDYHIRSDVYEPRREAVQLKGSVADYHEATASISFDLGGFVDVIAGKGQVLWGPAPTDNLGLSANTPSYNLLRLKTRLGALRFEHLAARLQPCPDRPDSPTCSGLADEGESYVVNGMTRRLDREKYLAAHRLEISPAPWMDIGIQEVVIYGDRGAELAYLNPFMFFWAAQSHLGDKDNVMMSLDIDVRPRRGVRLYAAYAIDDLKKLKVFSNDFANKFSFQAGALFSDPLGLRDTDVRAEYVRVEPWIYTHKFPINTFRHFDAPLGHSLGPNADRLAASVERRWHPQLATRLRWSRTRHGDNVLLADGSILNVGGDLHLGWRPGDDRDVKEFLDGRRSQRTAAGVDVDWQVAPRLRAVVSLDWEDGEQVPLAPRWLPGVPLPFRTGYGDGRQTHLSLDLRYGLL